MIENFTRAFLYGVAWNLVDCTDFCTQFPRSGTNRGLAPLMGCNALRCCVAPRRDMNLINLSQQELESFIAEIGEKPFRAKQIFQWLWQKYATSFDEMTNLSKDLRSALEKHATLVPPEIDTVSESEDGTIKFLLKLHDGKLVETVLIPAEDRYTQCLSTQVGCAMACTFCNTGQMGFERNMTAGEIAAQTVLAKKFLAERGLKGPSNLVFMGMGEPLMNLENLIGALKIFTHPHGLLISKRKMTVSTVGFPDKLRKLGETGLALPAISLHAATQELREKIMPRAAKVHLDDLMRALDNYPKKPRERVTYEYLLLRDVNDSMKHAKDVVRLLGHRRCKVNLIAYNPTEGSPYQAPDPDQVLAFEDYLRDKNMTCTIRKSKGQDIKAACGQLKASVGKQ